MPLSAWCSSAMDWSGAEMADAEDERVLSSGVQTLLLRVLLAKVEGTEEEEEEDEADESSPIRCE